MAGPAAQANGAPEESTLAASATIMSAKQYESFAVTEEGHRVELHGGRPVEKPERSIAHEWSQARLAMQLGRQLDPAEYLVQSGARLKRDDEHYFIPDIAIVPVSSSTPTATSGPALTSSISTTTAPCC